MTRTKRIVLVLLAMAGLLLIVLGTAGGLAALLVRSAAEEAVERRLSGTPKAQIC